MNYNKKIAGIFLLGLLPVLLVSNGILANYINNQENINSEGKSIEVTSAESHPILFFAPTDYLMFSVRVNFSFISNEDINITYGCGSPFKIELVNTPNWEITTDDCVGLSTHQLTAGTSNHSITGMVKSTGALSDIKLPQEIQIVVVLAQNLIISEPFTLNLS